MKRKKIIKRYFRKEFFFDLITIGPFFFYYFFRNYKFLELFFMIRMLKISTFFRKLDQFLSLRDKAKGIFDLIQLMVSVFIVAHIFSCLWYYIGN